MDDVYVIIGLLLFGSLLFCLCCYKVSNLLYMLYHIDDAASDDDLLPIGAFAAAAAAAAGSSKDPFAVGADGTGGGGGDKMGGDDGAAAALIMSEYVSQERMQGNHVGNLAGSFSGPSYPSLAFADSQIQQQFQQLQQQQQQQQQHRPAVHRGLRQAESATSLSVGVQVKIMQP